MKTNFTIIFTLLYLSSFSQNKGNEYVSYLVGSPDMPEYKMEIKQCDTKNIKPLSNGIYAPVLSKIVLNKKKYIGGYLVAGKDSTKISNIKLEPAGNSAKFTVTGKNFTRSFIIDSGIILSENDREITFYSKDLGAWTLRKNI
jgi:hypothetical protein